MAPRTKVEKVVVSVGSGDVVTADFTLASYWAPLPTKITGVDSSIVGLTTDEQVILDDLAKLNFPDFNFGVSVASVSGRTNPFAL